MKTTKLLTIFLEVILIICGYEVLIDPGYSYEWKCPGSELFHFI